jgi:hypothetical protein
MLDHEQVKENLSVIAERGVGLLRHGIFVQTVCAHIGLCEGEKSCNVCVS